MKSIGKMGIHIGIMAPLMLAFLLTGCRQEKSTSDERQAVDSNECSVTETAMAYVDSLKMDSTANASQNDMVSVIHMDSYDDGYQDGESMAEEDRLAGKPRMQVGMDDDEEDEDYEDGFDDGYDE